MIFLDFEGRSRVTDLRAVGATRYATDTSTQVLCMAWAFDQEDDIHLWHRHHPWIEKSGRPDELIERIASGELVEAHNAKFEYLIWNYVLMREFPEFNAPLLIEQMRCSAAKASCVSLPRALGEAAKAVGLSEQKDDDGRRLIQKLSKPMRAARKGKFEALRCDSCNGSGRIDDETCEDCGGAGRVHILVPGEALFCEEEIEHRRNWKYCEQDIRTERALSNFCPEMTERELEYWLMDFRMNVRGIKLDSVAAEAAIDLCAAEVERLNTEMKDLTGRAVLKGSQRIPFRNWINGKLIEIGEEPIPDTRADTLSFRLHGVPTKAAEEARIALAPKMREQWAAKGPIGEQCRRAMEISMEVNRSSVAKFRRMMGSVCADGRLHDIMLYNGADRTGRWSGQGVQPHNFVRGFTKDMVQVWELLLEKNLDLITVIEGPALPVLAKACRGALIASDNKELYAADFKSIEACKLAWMSSCAPLLTLFQTGGDAYCDMASGIYEREITKANKVERQLGKTAVLGLGYSMGWEKFQTTVYMNEGIWLDDEFCKRIVNVYRKEKYPEIPAFWRATENAAIKAVQDGGEWRAGGDDFGFGSISYFVRDRFLHCRLPSGRLLAYLDPEVHTRVNYRFAALNARGTDCTVSFNAAIGAKAYAVRRHAEIMAMRQRKELLSEPPDTFLTPHLSFMGRHIVTKQWVRIGTHGGSLVENADQASSRDLLAEAMLRVDRNPDFDLLLSIHDEVIAEAPIGTATIHDFESMMSEVPSWSPGMPISAEGWIGPRLRK